MKRKHVLYPIALVIVLLGIGYQFNDTLEDKNTKVTMKITPLSEVDASQPPKVATLIKGQPFINTHFNAPPPPQPQSFQMPKDISLWIGNDNNDGGDFPPE